MTRQRRSTRAAGPPPGDSHAAPSRRRLALALAAAVTAAGHTHHAHAQDQAPAPTGGPTGPGAAFTPPDPAAFDRVLAARIEANEALAETQARIDRLDDEARRMLDRYRQTLDALATSRRYGDQVARLIAAQEAEKADFEARLDRVGETKRRVVPLMLDMVDHLARFIEADTPFLLGERRDRVAALRAALDRADVPTAEKFRAVLDAYQTEAQYGRTLGAYKAELPGTDRTVDLLRVGRIALIYRSLDGRDLGYWDREAHDWAPLPGRYRRTLDSAFKIARKQAAPQLLILPTPVAAAAGVADRLPIAGDAP
ncbi:uncharacterized protein DUF3450 [Rhodothalassium salexigens DSM 2132]|uniref:Uncharacterized protein DUF3450 n=1 Tax=Rhodothalassium salexigens DSM 2132 TaxID=1188247 RepID=A0A4R2PIC6_RHOSA|nr:DUF3450 domain-containing protein [Rhodothalassium salexigens]MBB4211297.1 hypothetical protein [Rhodothalassium salexigens DSM 2132]MBK1639379.1 hypothetical protein [Rhodothalassium salexigens DSM 2132]TCP35219.1 uncharacterized protein DUF3450 [Rhodothalassium salexigens DSM 2132]